MQDAKVGRTVRPYFQFSYKRLTSKHSLITRKPAYFDTDAPSALESVRRGLRRYLSNRRTVARMNAGD